MKSLLKRSLPAFLLFLPLSLGTIRDAGAQTLGEGDYLSDPTGWTFIHAEPAPFDLKHVQDRATLVAIHVPIARDNGSVAAPGEPQNCFTGTEPDLRESLVAWASLREVMRYVGVPGLIISGPECVAVRAALQASWATTGDPTFTDGPDEVVAVRTEPLLAAPGGSGGREAALRETAKSVFSTPNGDTERPWTFYVLSAESASAILDGNRIAPGETAVLGFADRSLIGVFSVVLPDGSD
ncbi:hypothetical protein [Fulvimarina sp. MAC8]|uniref:hypothetical protein n=1 Tax=Fulvimarina sp. MAC8 TaxID=3162874 RepID=UPI0032EE5D23